MIQAQVLRALAFLALAVLLAWPAWGQVPNTPDTQNAPNAPTTTGTGTPIAGTVAELPIPAAIQALIDGQLVVSASPQSLFELPLADEAALAVEAARIRALLSLVALAEAPPSPRRRAPPPLPEVVALRKDIAAMAPERWAARMALDRARLRFYDLPPAERQALLQRHAERQAAARPRETAAEQRIREAAAERLRLLEAARLARTEAERLVAAESARQASLKARVAKLSLDLQAERSALAARGDLVLGWQRRVRETASALPGDADAVYEGLNRALADAREELDSAQRQRLSDDSRVPEQGADPTADLPPEVPVAELRQLQQQVAASLAAARRQERALREDRADALLNEVTALNRARLQLLPRLSRDLRQSITGLGARGWQEATAELGHLRLVLAAHTHELLRLPQRLRTSGMADLSWWGIAFSAVPWALLLAVFVWLRRRLPVLLKDLDAEMELEERRLRLTSASPQRRAVQFLNRIYRPLVWLGLFAAALWLLPEAAAELLEVQLLTTIVGWSLGGALLVNVLNATAAGGIVGLRRANAAGAALRLRSLRLTGYTAVALALVLTLTDRLVGKGAFHALVIMVCWFAVIPVFLVLVRWWRSTVFERIALLRRKTPLQEWVLTHREGWRSFFAAMVGAVQMFASGALKLLRIWASGFESTRRIHAYVFQRELRRRGEGVKKGQRLPLGPQALEALSPDRAFMQWLNCPADGVAASVLARVGRQRGGVLGVVGVRGMGKSSLVRQLSERLPGAVSVCCSSFTTPEDIRRATARLLDPALPADTQRLVLLDDAHTLIRPEIGGLAAFDEVLAHMRMQSLQTTCVLVIDHAQWAFLSRARDARPLFDETHLLQPWSEEEIGTLLDERSADAGITPRYDDLLGELPADADEIDRLDALKACRTAYIRMLWDHVLGNPALALQAWRASLARNEDGQVFVQPLHVPDSKAIEALPDSSLFVLRAVLRLQPAAAEDVALATGLGVQQVLDAFHVGQARGILTDSDGRAGVAWPWLRVVLRQLDRRHLLAAP
jgi:hypothetical protein